MDELEKIQAALLFGFEAVLGDVGCNDRGLRDWAGSPIRPVCSAEIRREAGVVEHRVNVCVDECRGLIRQAAKIDMNHLNEVAELIYHNRFENELLLEVIEDLSRLLRHILERKVESPSIAQHRFMRRVDEFSSAFGDLFRKQIALREAAPADARICLIHLWDMPAAASESAHASPAIPAPTMPTSMEGFCGSANNLSAGDRTAAAAPAAPAFATVPSHSRRL